MRPTDLQRVKADPVQERRLVRSFLRRIRIERELSEIIRDEHGALAAGEFEDTAKKALLMIDAGEW